MPGAARQPRHAQFRAVVFNEDFTRPLAWATAAEDAAYDEFGRHVLHLPAHPVPGLPRIAYVAIEREAVVGQLQQPAPPVDGGENAGLLNRDGDLMNDNDFELDGFGNNLQDRPFGDFFFY
jgi:hypothetical protein